MTERSDEKAPGGIRGALSRMLPVHGSLHQRISAAMTLYAICVVLLIGGISYVSVDFLIRKNMRLSMQSNTQHQVDKLSYSLDSLQQSLYYLSSNTLLINAIVDTSGSRAYIDSFVKSYRPGGHESIRLTLCDFQGSPIASNLPMPIPYNSRDLLLQTVEKGSAYTTVLDRNGSDNGVWLLLAYPVVWEMTHRPEGILVAEFPVGEMVDANLFALGDNGTGFRLMSGDQALYSKNFVDRLGLHRFDVPLHTAAPMNALRLSMQIVNLRNISLWWMIPIYAVTGGILLMLTAILARQIAFNATSQLRALGEIARGIAESGSLESRAEVAGPDDVKALASTFNAMIDRVRASKEDLERRVQERTAELSIANEDLNRLNRERELAIDRLREALDKISTLRGMLPICSTCKKIRDDKGYWNQIEVYISEHTEADFSHGICPDCARKLYGDLLDK